jgi:hypothetical protein
MRWFVRIRSGAVPGDGWRRHIRAGGGTERYKVHEQRRAEAANRICMGPSADVKWAGNAD